MTIVQLATKYSNAFEEAKRDDGTRYMRVKEAFQGDEFLKDLVRGAHDNEKVLPEDVIYKQIPHIFTAIAECDEDSDADSIRDTFNEQLDADIYNRDLLAWLGGHPYAPSYIDDAMKEMKDSYKGDESHFWNTVRYAQCAWLREIADDILNDLEGKAQELTDEEDDAEAKISDIFEVIECHPKNTGYSPSSFQGYAKEWHDLGFSHGEVEKWLHAVPLSSPLLAAILRDCGVNPENAAMTGYYPRHPKTSLAELLDEGAIRHPAHPGYTLDDALDRALITAEEAAACIKSWLREASKNDNE